MAHCVSSRTQTIRLADCRMSPTLQSLCTGCHQVCFSVSLPPFWPFALSLSLSLSCLFFPPDSFPPPFPPAAQWFVQEAHFLRDTGVSFHQKKAFPPKPNPFMGPPYTEPHAQTRTHTDTGSHYILHLCSGGRPCL